MQKKTNPLHKQKCALRLNKGRKANETNMVVGFLVQCVYKYVSKMNVKMELTKKTGIKTSIDQFNRLGIGECCTLYSVRCAHFK